MSKKCISTILWPFALKHANEIFNKYMIDKQGHSPVMKFSGVQVDIIDTHNDHTLGCPSYVLNASLQNGNSIPKWDSRVRIGVFLGKSPHHAASVGLILNLKTGHVSPKFHVVYDDDFTTVDNITNGREP